MSLVKSNQTNKLSNFYYRHADLIQRILFLLGALIVYRLGSHIPVPGIDPEKLAKLFESTEGTVVSIFNTFSGGALERMSIMALGIMPYITSAIVIQMFTSVLPYFEALKKEGETGQRKINQYTRQATLLFASAQAIGICFGLQSQGFTFTTGFSFMLPGVVSLVTGTMFLMWLGEQVTERGIGNGISMLIFASIVASMPAMFGQLIESVQKDQIGLIAVLLFIAVVIIVSAVIVYFERALRKVPVNYAQKQQTNKLLVAKQSHLPLKLNMASVIPAIFAGAILAVPNTLSQFAGSSAEPTFFQSVLQGFNLMMTPEQPIYLLVYASMIMFFCYFYTALMFSPKEVAENLKRSGAYVPGIRPGLQTQRYLDHLLNRITFIGAVYMTLVCVVPIMAQGSFPAFQVGSLGVSLLIAIVVLMDFLSHLQNHIMKNKYDNVALFND